MSLYSLSKYIITSIVTLIASDCIAAEKSKKPVVFEPTVESLQQYECPEWFKDAKFGIWSCWNAYTVPGVGDWYARNMYKEGHPHYKYHLENYGHPSEVGYKDIVQMWKGEKFNPDDQIALFKKIGARYFVVMANHHDNFDLWNSKHHKWNSVNYGPKKDIVDLWRKAALKQDMRFGITSHLERTWSWFQTNKGADKKGPYKNVPYDGNDPKYQDFYLPPEPAGDSNQAQPKNATPWWRNHWYKRVTDVIDSYKPDLFYVDGGVPFPGDDNGQTGLKMIAHLYNQNSKWHDGKNEAVMCIKNWLHVAPNGQWGHYWEGIATLDLERTKLKKIKPEPWQTDTSIGDWTWRRTTRYRPAKEIIHELVDIVSKNGNLLLNVSPQPDGTLDDKATQLLLDIGKWMDINSECIYGTRPWVTSGEGGVRFTTKDNALYAIILDDTPDSIKLHSMRQWQPEDVKSVELLKGHKVDWKITREGLTVKLNEASRSKYAYVLKITCSKHPAKMPANSIE